MSLIIRVFWRFFVLDALCLQATGCVTAATVNVKAAGQGSIVTVALARRRACQRMALSAATVGGVSVASVSALYLEHLGRGVKTAQHVEMPAALQGESTSVQSDGERRCRVVFVSNWCFLT